MVGISNALFNALPLHSKLHMVTMCQIGRKMCVTGNKIKLFSKQNVSICKNRKIINFRELEEKKTLPHILFTDDSTIVEAPEGVRKGPQTGNKNQIKSNQTP